MRHVLVDNLNKVIQAIELDPRWADAAPAPWHWDPPAGVQVVRSDTAGAGWTFAGGVFTPPPTIPDPPPTPDQIRAQTFFALPDRQDIITRLQTATPAQIDSWLVSNVTNLAQARTVLGALIKVFCVGAPQ